MNLHADEQQLYEGGEQDARHALEEVRGRLRRGERVRPSRVTFDEVADAWLASQSDLRPNTVASYESALRVRLRSMFGRLKISELTEDHVAALVADMRAEGRKGWTIRATMTPLRQILSYAARRGDDLLKPDGSARAKRASDCPVAGMRTLDRAQIGALLDAAPPVHRGLLTVAVFTGLRLGELLGLTWANVDFAGGRVQIRRHLDRHGRHSPSF